MATQKNNPIYTTKELVIMALFAAILCVSAYISITLPNGSHITMLNFVVTLVALSFPLSQSIGSILVWLLLGAIGLPVFVAGQAGIGYLFGIYGGYAGSFLVVAILCPLLCGKTYRRIRTTAVAIFSVILVDILGSLQWMLLGHLTWQAAFIVGFLPFIVLDVVKAVIAAQIVPAIRIAIQAGSNH